MGNASKGYRRASKTYRLRFEDDEYEGLVVRARSVSVGQLLSVSRLAGADMGDLRPEDMEKLEELFGVFAGALIEWNLEDEETGEPVPATLEGIKRQDADFVMPIVKAWFDAIAGVAGPLGRGSSNGGPSLEGSLPMEPRSVSPLS